MFERIGYFIITRLIYRIGRFGTLRNKRSVLVILMCIEIIRLGVNRQFRRASVYRDDRLGQRIVRMVLTVAAAESAIGLAVLVVYFRVHGTIGRNTMNVLHG